MGEKHRFDNLLGNAASFLSFGFTSIKNPMKHVPGIKSLVKLMKKSLEAVYDKADTDETKRNIYTAVTGAIGNYPPAYNVTEANKPTDSVKAILKGTLENAIKEAAITTHKLVSQLLKWYATFKWVTRSLNTKFEAVVAAQIPEKHWEVLFTFISQQADNAMTDSNIFEANMPTNIDKMEATKEAVAFFKKIGHAPIKHDDSEDDDDSAKSDTDNSETDGEDADESTEADNKKHSKKQVGSKNKGKRPRGKGKSANKELSFERQSPVSSRRKSPGGFRGFRKSFSPAARNPRYSRSRSRSWGAPPVCDRCYNSNDQHAKKWATSHESSECKRFNPDGTEKEGFVKDLNRGRRGSYGGSQGRQQRYR